MPRFGIKGLLCTICGERRDPRRGMRIFERLGSRVALTLRNNTSNASSLVRDLLCTGFRLLRSCQYVASPSDGPNSVEHPSPSKPCGLSLLAMIRRVNICALRFVPTLSDSNRSLFLQATNPNQAGRHQGAAQNNYLAISQCNPKMNGAIVGTACNRISTYMRVNKTGASGYLATT